MKGIGFVVGVLEVGAVCSIGSLCLFDACNLNKRSYIVGATVSASLFSPLKGFLFT